jgi:hypothetical protein
MHCIDWQDEHSKQIHCIDGQDEHSKHIHSVLISRGVQETVLPVGTSRPTLGPADPPIQWAPGVKRLGREADHLPPSVAEVEN